MSNTNDDVHFWGITWNNNSFFFGACSKILISKDRMKNIPTYVERFKPDKEICLHIWLLASAWLEQSCCVTQALSSKGSTLRRGKTTWGVHKTSKEVDYLRCQGSDKSASDAGASCAGSWHPKIHHPRLGNRRWCMHWMDLMGKLDLPHGCSLFSTPLLCCHLM